VWIDTDSCDLCTREPSKRAPRDAGLGGSAADEAQLHRSEYATVIWPVPV